MLDTSVEPAGRIVADAPEPADLDTAFVELIERIDFDWPQSVAAEVSHGWTAGMAAAVLALAALSATLRCRLNFGF
jgi:hypothetical protein